MKFYLNSLGINNSAGSSLNEVYEAIFKKNKKRSKRVNLISGRQTVAFDVQASLPEIPSHLGKFKSRNNRLLLQAVLQIKDQIQDVISKYGTNRVGIVLGTSTSGIKETEIAFIEKMDGKLSSNFNYYIQEVSNPADFLSEYLELKGIHYTVSTACTSSAKAFIEARRLLSSNFCDAVIVGGVDTISSLTLNGFDALDSVSSQMTNPFSANRMGINIGEGAAIFILSKDPSPIEFLSYGESSDAYHISSPDPEGRGAEIAIRQALTMASLSPEDVGYVNLHGTGTPKNDEMESRLMTRVFKDVLASSTKPFIGHTLGAAAAQELALCYLALSKVNREALLPVHLWDGVQDPALPPLHFVTEGHSIKNRICMSNSFAFGGNNVSLILKGNS